MPNLCSFNQCCGCSACYAACSKSAISMCPDKEGFLHPVIDGGKCIDCKLCEKVCPILHQSDPRKPIAVYAAKAMDDSLRQQSSSGGVFSLLSQRVIDQGGVVYGAAIRKGDLMVYHCAAEKEEELSLLRGSKYVQSEMGETYRRVKSDLENGRQVMFSGTPCQIAGLRTYLRKDYDNLLCVDVICHAVPSPLAWKKYLESRAIQLGRAPSANTFDCTRIHFRSKKFGWKNFSMSLGTRNEDAYIACLKEDLFLRGFLRELFNRRSCYQCMFRDLRSGSDLTMADYWGVNDTFTEMDDDMGVSVVMVNTQKGERYFASIKDDLLLRIGTFTDVMIKNSAVHSDCVMHRNRSKFFKAMAKGKNFDRTVRTLLLPSRWSLFKEFVNRISSAVR